MRIFGAFWHNGIIIPNLIADQGAVLMLRNFFRGEAVLPANYYLGLTSAMLDFDSVLADAAAGEIAGNGYARQALNRGTGAWTVETVNSTRRARSSVANFTASADWSSTYRRMFLCDASAGTAGNLIAASGPTDAPVQVLSGFGPAVAYLFNIQG